jgi:hypothetical protein
MGYSIENKYLATVEGALRAALKWACLRALFGDLDQEKEVNHA